MNTTFETDKENLRYAEYVLGVLDADARAAVAQEIDRHAEAAAAVALWQRHLTPLSEDIPMIAPPAHVWARIQRALGLAAPVRTASRTRVWDNLPLWHWIGIGASAAAVALATFFVVLPWRMPAPAAVRIPLMVASIAQTDGVVGWTAAMDVQRREIVILPAAPRAIAADRSTELWLIPQGGKPIPVGVFASNAPATLALDQALAARLGPTATLAVSIEPAGGSPTGQPTGPVIGQGAIRGAPVAG